MEESNNVIVSSEQHSNERRGQFSKEKNKRQFCSTQNHRKRKLNMDKEDNVKKSKPFEVGKRLSETDVGITEFISDYEGFSGIVKDKYSDFQVHEIAKNDEVAKLTSFTIPEINKQNKSVDEMKKNLPDGIREKLEQFLNNPMEVCKMEIDVTDFDKETRRNIHQISKSVPNILSQTEEKDKRKILIISSKKAKTNFFANSRSDKRVDWSQCKGDYLHFVMYKENLDTMDALNQLAKQLYLNVSALNYAGTKDRRAKTSQWISLKKGNPYLIQRAGMRIRHIYLGNFKFTTAPQKLGFLKGNQFTIAIRNVTADDEKINMIMNSLRDRGFINYFGLQRFGSIASIPTYQIGIALLKDDWQEAVNLILKPREEEQDFNLADARIIYESTKDAEKALKAIKRKDKIEAKLLQGISICGEKSLQNALDHIPKWTLLMYIHSYQSFVWNNIVTRRIREFGKVPVVGDLVYASNEIEETEKSEKSDEFKNELKNDKTEKLVIENGKEEETLLTEDVKNEKSEEQKTEIKTKELITTEEKVEKTESKNEEILKDDSKFKKDDNEKEIEDNKKTEMKLEESLEVNAEKDNQNNEAVEQNGVKFEEDKDEKEQSRKKKVQSGKTEDFSKELPKIKVLTENDLGNYSLADIIMPLPGYKVIYPSYAKSWYDEILKKDGLDLNFKRKNEKYSLSGSYRKIINLPYDLSLQIKHYDDRHADLIASDLDEMRGIKLPECADGNYKALIVKFSLPSSTYATCALREILKQDMSCQIQAAKSAAHT